MCVHNSITNETRSPLLDKQEQIMNLMVITETKIKAKLRWHFHPLSWQKKKRRLLSPVLSEPVEDTDIFLNG